MTLRRGLVVMVGILGVFALVLTQPWWWDLIRYWPSSVVMEDSTLMPIPGDPEGRHERVLLMARPARFDWVEPRVADSVYILHVAEFPSGGPLTRQQVLVAYPEEDELVPWTRMCETKGAPLFEVQDLVFLELGYRHRATGD